MVWTQYIQSGQRSSISQHNTNILSNKRQGRDIQLKNDLAQRMVYHSMIARLLSITGRDVVQTCSVHSPINTTKMREGRRWPKPRIVHSSLARALSGCPFQLEYQITWNVCLIQRLGLAARRHQAWHSLPLFHCQIRIFGSGPYLHAYLLASAFDFQSVT